ncbi:MAG: NADH-quinone oxidoreductase subunit D [Bacteriovoracia bacterium]
MMTTMSSDRIRMDVRQGAGLGPLFVNISTDGEVVFRAEIETGFLHRGIEKIGESMTWLGFLPFIERVDYMSAIHGSHAYAMAVEKLAGIEVPLRAEYIRVVASELNRMGSHYMSLGLSAKQLGLDNVYELAMAEREKINNLFEALAGARLTFSYIRIGGVSGDISEGFIEKVFEYLDHSQEKREELVTMFLDNPISSSRLNGLGSLSKEKALEAGISGPALRACGEPYDIRKGSSYSVYSSLEFLVPVEERGDSLSRCWIRVHELEQSAQLIRSALNKLPSGTYCVDVPRIFKPQKGRSYAAVESPRGIFSVFVESTGERTPYRVKIRTPSFAVLSIFSSVSKQVTLADLPALIASFDVLISEVDR